MRQTGQPLSQLAERSRGVVCCFDAEHREACRLREMGLCAGCCVQMVQLGDPVILDVDGSRMAISRELAQQIMVTPGAA